nr:hypothetical protein Iba_chr11cCG10510 [Ipomoea batatas]
MDAVDDCFKLSSRAWGDDSSDTCDNDSMSSSCLGDFDYGDEEMVNCDIEGVMKELEVVTFGNHVGEVKEVDDELIRDDMERFTERGGRNMSVVGESIRYRLLVTSDEQGEHHHLARRRLAEVSTASRASPASLNLHLRRQGTLAVVGAEHRSSEGVEHQLHFSFPRRSNGGNVGPFPSTEAGGRTKQSEARMLQCGTEQRASSAERPPPLQREGGSLAGWQRRRLLLPALSLRRRLLLQARAGVIGGGLAAATVSVSGVDNNGEGGFGDLRPSRLW